MSGWKPRNLILHDYGGTPDDKDGVFNPYHALVYPNGKVRYRNPSDPYGSPAPHAYRMNNDAIGLSYAGPVGSKPTPEALGAIRGEYDKINATFPGIKPMSHGEAYQATRGTPQQASRDGRGLDEAIWRHDLLGTTPTEEASSGPVPMAQRSLTSYAGLGGNDMAAPRGMAAGRSGLAAISPEWERDKMSVGALPQAQTPAGQQFSTDDEDAMLKQLAGQTIQPYRPGWAGVAGIGNSIMGGMAMTQLRSNAAKKQGAEQEAWKAVTGMAGNPQQAIQQMMQTAPPGSAPQQYALKQFDAMNSRAIEQNTPDYQAKLALMKAQTEKMTRESASGGEAPMNVREWEYFKKLPEQEQQQYLTMKRSQQFLDTGTGFVRPNTVNPNAAPVQQVQKDIAGAEQQKVVGRETGERQMQAPKAVASLQASDAKTDLVLSTLADARAKVSKWSTGVGGALLMNLPATEANDLRETIKTLVVNSGFEELQSMRDNSPTGSALGQVAVQELEMLQKVRTSLEQSQTSGQLLKNMDTFEAFVRGSKERRRKAFEMTYGAGGTAMQMPQQPATGGGLRSGNYRYNPQTGELEPQ